jgi:hypothetical protein
MVVLAVIMSFTSSIVVVARVVLIAAITVVTVAVVVDARSPSTSLDGVPGVVVGPELALDHRCCGPGPTSTILIPGGGRVQVIRGRRCPSITFRPLA